MRRIWVAVGIAVIVTGLSICEYMITFSAVKEIDSFVSTVNAENVEDATNNCKDIKKVWQKKKPFLDVFLNHEEVDAISISINAALSYAESKADTELLAECARLKEMADSLTESEKFMMENIL